MAMRRVEGEGQEVAAEGGLCSATMTKAEMSLRDTRWGRDAKARVSDTSPLI